MKIVLFGATGMVGQGVLREALVDPDVERIVLVTRTTTGQTHPKIEEILHRDFTNFAELEGKFREVDACLFCLGVSSAGMDEADYRRITYDFTLAAAKTLLAANARMKFLYVSGAGTEAKAKTMWARVKGETENALLAMGFGGAYMLRPGYIQPMHGIQSKTRVYRVSYAIMGPLFPILNALIPRFVTTTERVGRAMLAIAKHGAPKTILENSDLNALADPVVVALEQPAGE